MNTKIIQNQIDLSVGIFDQSFKKRNNQLITHGIFVNHESNLTPVGNRRDQLDSFAFCTQADVRCFSLDFCVLYIFGIIDNSP